MSDTFVVDMISETTGERIANAAELAALALNEESGV